MTRAFIRDYEIWNNHAYADYERTNSFEAAEATYDALIAKFCEPGRGHLNLALGSYSSHSPAEEQPESEVRNGDTSVVRTKRVYEWSHVTFNEYHYLLKNGEWWLLELYYLDEYDGDRPLPCL